MTQRCDAAEGRREGEVRCDPWESTSNLKKKTSLEKENRFAPAEISGDKSHQEWGGARPLDPPPGGQSLGVPAAKLTQFRPCSALLVQLTRNQGSSRREMSFLSSNDLFTLRTEPLPLPLLLLRLLNQRKDIRGQISLCAFQLENSAVVCVRFPLQGEMVARGAEFNLLFVRVCEDAMGTVSTNFRSVRCPTCCRMTVVGHQLVIALSESSAFFVPAI